MSMVTISKSGRRHKRAFDHDRARLLRKKWGWTCREIADHFGVSTSAVQRVTNQRTYERMAAQAAQRARDVREPCKGGCGRLVWRHGVQGRARTGYCRTCIGPFKTKTVRAKTLLCTTCKRWRLDKMFPKCSGCKARRQRAYECRHCQTESRRTRARNT